MLFTFLNCIKIITNTPLHLPLFVQHLKKTFKINSKHLPVITSVTNNSPNNKNVACNTFHNFNNFHLKRIPKPMDKIIKNSWTSFIAIHRNNPTPQKQQRLPHQLGRNNKEVPNTNEGLAWNKAKRFG